MSVVGQLLRTAFFFSINIKIEKDNIVIYLIIEATSKGRSKMEEKNFSSFKLLYIL